MFRPLFRSSKRLFSAESGTSERTFTKEVEKDGWKVLEKINVVNNWKKLSRTQKWLIGGYSGLAVSNFMFVTYNDGKRSLMQYRKDRNKANFPIKDTEWDAVYDGCNENLLDNFWSSTFFPFSTVSNVMPHLVMLFNPENKQ